MHSVPLADEAEMPVLPVPEHLPVQNLLRFA